MGSISRDAEEFFEKANEAFRNGKYDEAIEYYEEALSLNPDFVEAWAGKGDAYEYKGEYEEAIRCYGKAISLNPDFASAWNNKGLIHDMRGEYDKALRCFNRVTSLITNVAVVWNNKGLVATKCGRYDEAIKHLDKATSIDPNDAEVWNNKGWAYDEMGEYDEAIRCYDKAISLKPDFAEAWAGKGDVYEHKGKYEKARGCWEKSLSIDPNQQEVKMRLTDKEGKEVKDDGVEGEQKPYQKPQVYAEERHPIKSQQEKNTVKLNVHGENKEIIIKEINSLREELEELFEQTYTLIHESENPSKALLTKVKNTKDRYREISYDEDDMGSLTIALSDLNAVKSELNRLKTESKRVVRQEKREREICRELREEVNEKEEWLEKEFERIYSLISGFEIEPEKLLSRIENMEDRFRDISYDENEIRSLKSTINEYDKINSELVGIEDDIDKIKEIKEDLEGLSSREPKIHTEEIEQAIEKNDLNRAEKALAGLKEKIRLKNEISELWKRARYVNTADIEKALDENKLSQAKRLLRERKEEVKVIEKIEDEIYDLKIKEEEINTDAIESALKDGDIDKAHRLLEKLKKNYEEYKETMDDFEILKNRVASLSNRLADGEISEETFRYAKEGIDHQRDKLESKLENLRKYQQEAEIQQSKYSPRSPASQKRSTEQKLPYRQIELSQQETVTEKVKEQKEMRDKGTDEVRINWCPRCRRVYPQDALYCGSCGDELTIKKNSEGSQKALFECAVCGAMIPPDVSSCPNCGIEFSSSTVKCSDCGAWIDSDAKRCPECGAEFGQ